uniref:Sialic acid-binding Ig-like lectin 5 n=1 Tax=Chinchilla lanigera TaxID=34839 RepID=A0A8C2YJ65_CHILA
MLRLLLLPLLWEGSLANIPGFQLTVPASVAVQEGQCIFIPCRVSYPERGWSNSTAAWGYWFKKGAKSSQDLPVATNNPHYGVWEETKERFHLLGDPGTYNCSLHIKNAQKRDTGVYFFRVERGSYVRYNYIHNQLCVFVMAPTETPDIHIAGTLESGHPGNVTCAAPWPCEQGTPPTFSWIGANLTSALGPEAARSSVLTVTPRPQDHGTNLTCQVTFPGAGVTVQRTVQLNVSYAAQSLIIQAFQGNDTGPTALANGSSFRIQEGQALRLVCAADSNPPSMLSWTRGSLTLQPSQHTDRRALELPLVELEDEGKYVCRAEHRLGSRTASVSLFVRSPPQLLGPTCSWEAAALHCSCSSHSWPAPSLRWRLGQGLLEGNSSNASFTVTSSSAGPWANSSLSLRGGLRSGLRLRCEAWNPHGTQTVTVLLLPEKPGPRAGVVQGAIGGAGVTVLLAVCLCFVFFMVKMFRKKLAVKGKSEDGTHLVTNTVSPAHQDHLNKAKADSTLDSTPTNPATASGEEMELHYASLSFHGLKPREPPDQEDSNATVYSEVRIRK